MTVFLELMNHNEVISTSKTVNIDSELLANYIIDLIPLAGCDATVYINSNSTETIILANGAKRKFICGERVIDSLTFTITSGSVLLRVYRKNDKFVDNTKNIEEISNIKDNLDTISYVEYTMSSDQTITTGAPQDLNFDTKVKDNLNEYDTTTHKFTATKKRIYDIYLECFLAYPNVEAGLAINIYKNGSATATRQKGKKIGANSPFELGIVVSTFLELDKDDYINIKIATTVSGNSISSISGNKLLIVERI